MSTNTPNYKLTKIDLTDAPPDITVLNHNWDTIDTKIKTALDHLGDNGIHVTPSQKSSWDSKADGNHNHNSNYAPISHSNDGNIHVTTGQKSSWDNKASATHGHSLSSLGAAPAGYGMGEVLWGNRITDALNISLPTGVYGWWDGTPGSINFPEPDFVGFAEIYNFNGDWQYVIARNMQTQRVFVNRYLKSWTGWQQLTDRIYRITPWIGNVSGSYEQSTTLSLPFNPSYILCDTTTATGPISCTNKTALLHPEESEREIVSTSTGYIKVKFDINTVVVKHRVTQMFGFKILAFQGGIIG
ncbi:MAG: hypothetical protein RR992_05895 [Clostridiales bacterium]